MVKIRCFFLNNLNRSVMYDILLFIHSVNDSSFNTVSIIMHIETITCLIFCWVTGRQIDYDDDNNLIINRKLTVKILRGYV
jgi:hypothetical protein